MGGKGDGVDAYLYANVSADVFRTHLGYGNMTYTEGSWVNIE